MVHQSHQRGGQLRGDVVARGFLVGKQHGGAGEDVGGVLHNVWKVHIHVARFRRKVPDAGLRERLLFLVREAEDFQLVFADAFAGGSPHDEQLIGNDRVLGVGAVVSLPGSDDVGQVWQLQHVRHLGECEALQGLRRVLVRVEQYAKRDGRVERDVVAIPVLHLDQHHRRVFDEVHVEVVALRDGGLFARAAVAARNSDGEREGLVILGDKLRESVLLTVCRGHVDDVVRGPDGLGALVRWAWL